MIVEALRKICPEAAFITEEGSVSYEEHHYKWIIDPLDGTTNFIHGLPPYCVSIALMAGNEVVVGVVYEVTHREMFYAWQGSAAWMNGEEIHVSKVDKLENALIAIGFSHAAFETAAEHGYLNTVAEYQRDTDGIRRIGSSTADLVYVACGRFDAFSQFGLSPWDVAAGVLIAKQAGAIVSDSKGGDNFVFGKEVVATTPLIYNEFMKSVK
jgi:myo-inositol-1(or 4)-monophosphatase